MNSQELGWVQLLLEPCERFAQLVLTCADVKADVVALGLDPVDIFDRDEQHATAARDGQSVRLRSSRGDAFEVRDRAAHLFVVDCSGDSLPRASQGPVEPVLPDRLEQIVDRARVEGAESISVVSRQKNCDRHADGADRSQYLKSVDLWHLHIEEDEIGLLVSNRVDRRLAVAAFADDLDVGVAPKQTPDRAPRQPLIVRNQCLNAHREHDLVRAGTDRSGTDTAAQTPTGSTFRSEKSCRLP